MNDRPFPPFAAEPRPLVAPRCARGQRSRLCEAVPRRRGIAVLLVLVLISTTLALSYAILRSQGTAAQVQGNTDLRLSARQAAMTGIAMGLKKMHSSSWGGVDTSLNGSLGALGRFQVAFTTGDPSLTSAHSDYGDYPYRVTLLSTGSATDAADPNRQATYRVRVVVRLLPRKLSDQPTEWPSMSTNTLHQYAKDGEVRLAVPCRIRGTIRSYGKWKFPADYNWGETEQKAYLSGLNLMRLAGQPDYRPFDSQITLPYDKQPTGLLSMLNTRLAIPTVDLTSTPASDWAFPGQVSTYRIYPGGRLYQVPTVAQSLWYTTLQPDPVNNPLGVYYNSGRVDLSDNVTIQGTLIQGTSGGDCYFSGRNIQIKPVDLPAVYPATRPVQLPVVVAKNDFKIQTFSQGSVTGLVAAWQRFEIASSFQGSTSVQMAGRIVAQDFRARGLYEWDWLTNSWWQWQYDAFTSQQSWGNPHFPSWLKSRWGLDYVPQIVIQPDSREVTYHYPWKNPSNPIYVAHPDDGGLRWEVLDWTENPPSG